MNKKNRMIYLADDNLAAKIQEMRNKYHLNISSLIRDFLEDTYNQLKDKKRG